MSTTWIPVAFRDYGNSKGFLRSTTVDAIMVQQVTASIDDTSSNTGTTPPPPTYEVRVFSRGAVFNVTSANKWNWDTVTAAVTVAQALRDQIIAAEATP
jgi:hypothetical protein